MGVYVAKKRHRYARQFNPSFDTSTGKLLDGWAVGNGHRLRLHWRNGLLIVWPDGYGRWCRQIRKDAGGYYIWYRKCVRVSLRIKAGR
ncbi:hypothetical protein HOR97_gp52 [Agrobacterium phage Atu_ph03]|uniref:Uncharacterized protein n=1 Tax=Agrobacterium phage Atu_ph03 TaxID=2024262 RepID=A0A2L0UZ64_9CAUD|nr:hypothetical protein HOR97_gp52 [Agrobacterium phage Atu_ph03]AUZ94800.1 hypothetical protein [Agrobacterium phage Atu_ph03]